MGIKKSLAFLMAAHSVHVLHAQNELLLRPSVGMEYVFANTEFAKIEKLKLKNNVFDLHFHAGLEVAKYLNKNHFFYLSGESRVSGYSYSSSYSNSSCPQRTSLHMSSTAYSFLGLGAGYGYTHRKRKKTNNGLTAEVSASSGINILLNQKNVPLDDMTRGINICNDFVFYTDRFIEYKSWGIGIQSKFYIDLYLKNKALFNFTFSYLKGLKNVTYDQLITRFNSDSYSNTFISKGSGFTATIGYPIKFFQRRHR